MESATERASAPEQGREGQSETKAQERAALLSPAQRADLLQARQERAYIVALNNEAWGNVSAAIKNAIAEFVRREKMRPGEIDVLGGRPYKNGYYYRRRLAELRLAGHVQDEEGYYILGSRDEELTALADAGDEWAIAERMHQMRERIRWSVPTDATHAYVVRVQIRGVWVEGCDYITPGRTKKRSGGGESKADPVGEDEPEKTVITRAYRRAGLLAAAYVPELALEEKRHADLAEIIEGQIEDIREGERATEEAAKIDPTPLIASANPADPYGIDGTTTADFAAAARQRGREAERAAAVPVTPPTRTVRRAPPERAMERATVASKAEPSLLDEFARRDDRDTAPHPADRGDDGDPY